MGITLNPQDKRRSLDRSSFYIRTSNDILLEKGVKFMKFLRGHKSETTAVLTGAALIPLTYVSWVHGAEIYSYEAGALFLGFAADILAFTASIGYIYSKRTRMRS